MHSERMLNSRVNSRKGIVPVVKIRTAWRLLALSFWTAFVYALHLMQWLLTFSFSSVERLGRQRLLRFWGRGVLRIVGIRLTFMGKPPVPPYYLICNHLSYFDAVVLASQLGCVFVVMSEVARWPILGFLAGQMRCIFVTRQRKRDTVTVNERIQAALRDGEGIVMFPEGRTSQGACVLPFKGALIEPAIRCSMPIHYATISYEAFHGSPPASQWVCWGTDVPFGTHVLRALSERGFRATLTFGSQPIRGEDRKVLIQQLQDAVAADFRPVQQANALGAM